jgi:hypothetical protein
LASYVKLSLPLKFAAGMYVKDPFVFRVSVPFVAVATRVAVTLPLSGSLSLASTPGAAIVRLPSSATG